MPSVRPGCALQEVKHTAQSRVGQVILCSCSLGRHLLADSDGGRARAARRRGARRSARARQRRSRAGQRVRRGQARQRSAAQRGGRHGGVVVGQAPRERAGDEARVGRCGAARARRRVQLRERLAWRVTSSAWCASWPD